MATKPNISLPGQHGADGPQHFIPPSARELRAQAVHRLQVGLLGLAAMLLLVGLASIIMERARMAESTMPGSAGVATAEASPKSDPLADIGVVPSPEAARPVSADAPPR
jgi:hypothetical protein